MQLVLHCRAVHGESGEGRQIPGAFTTAFAVALKEGVASFPITGNQDRQKVTSIPLEKSYFSESTSAMQGSSSCMDLCVIPPASNEWLGLDSLPPKAAATPIGDIGLATSRPKAPLPEGTPPVHQANRYDSEIVLIVFVASDFVEKQSCG
jgi:hypothetical protein